MGNTASGEVGRKEGAQIERCRLEIVCLEAELLAGNPDVGALWMAPSEWSSELRISKTTNAASPKAGGTEGSEFGEDQALRE
jgi:hypothetical protein